MSKKDVPDFIRRLLEDNGIEVIGGGEISVGGGEHCPDCGNVHAKPAIGIPEAQAMTLKETHGLLTNPTDIKVGDFVRYRKLLSAAYIKNWDALHIVIEILDEPVKVNLTMADTSDCAATRKLDVVLAVVARDGSVLRYWGDSRELEPYPDADKLIKHDS